MAIPYFRGHSWNDLTRDERFYCFHLYQNAKSNPCNFAQWVAEKAGLSIDSTSDWDIGVEVCFYRDYLWHMGKPVHGSGYSPKRTFDLCLFGPMEIMIIEAKVDQAFDSEQNKVFATDAGRLRDLLETETLKVHLVALASSKYYDADAKNGSGMALQPFHGRISWADTYRKYGDKILKQADDLYGSNNRKLFS